MRRHHGDAVSNPTDAQRSHGLPWEYPDSCNEKLCGLKNKSPMRNQVCALKQSSCSLGFPGCESMNVLGNTYLHIQCGTSMPETQIMCSECIDLDWSINYLTCATTSTPIKLSIVTMISIRTEASQRSPPAMRKIGNHCR